MKAVDTDNVGRDEIILSDAKAGRLRLYHYDGDAYIESDNVSYSKTDDSVLLHDLDGDGFDEIIANAQVDGTLAWFSTNNSLALEDIATDGSITEGSVNTITYDLSSLGLPADRVWNIRLVEGSGLSTATENRLVTAIEE